jgi:hypothetical protein
MSNDSSDGKSLLSKLNGKLAVILGSGLAILNGTSVLQAKSVVYGPATPSSVETVTTVSKPLAPKLVLKQVKAGYQMIAQHDSHSSHGSHGSHDSHASHASHVSGGFV